MFEGPEYKSYIELCCELRLEREFESFDAVLDPHRSVVEWDNWTDKETGRERVEDLVWLPRLDQWLDLIDAIEGRMVLSRSHGFWRATNGLGIFGGGEDDEFEVPEEAAARLWQALQLVLGQGSLQSEI